MALPPFRHRVILGGFSADTPARAKFARTLSTGARLACDFCLFEVRLLALHAIAGYPCRQVVASSGRRRSVPSPSPPKAVA